MMMMSISKLYASYEVVVMMMGMMYLMMMIHNETSYDTAKAKAAKQQDVFILDRIFDLERSYYCVDDALPILSLGPSSEYSSAAQSFARPYRRRSRYVSSSSDTSYPSSSPPPHKRRRVLIYSSSSSASISPSPLVGLSRMTSDAIKQLSAQHVVKALRAREANRINGNGIGNRNMTNGNAKGVDSALTWWNSHVKTVGLEIAYEMSWKELMKMMTEVALVANQKIAITCFECGRQGHYQSEYPKLKDQNHRNQADKPVIVEVSHDLRVIIELIYYDLYLGGKALVERENVGFELTKSSLCPSFVKDVTVMGVYLYDELSDKELKQIEADDQAIQTILLGLPEDIYAAEKKAKLFNEWEMFTFNEGESIESYYHRFLKLMNDLKRNKHFSEKIASNLKRRDAAYLQTQLLIAQKEEAGIQLQVEEYDLMAAAVDLDEIEELNANCILMANLQQASTSNGSTEVHKNFDDNEIFNMFTQEQYTELLEHIFESHQVPKNDNDVISEDTSVEQGGETVEQHPKIFEETRALYVSLYQNLAIKVEKVNSISELNKQLSMEKSTVSFLLEEKKKLKSDFKTHEDEFLDKQIQLEKKTKELNNIFLKTDQSIQTIHMLSPKPNSFYHTEHKMALGYQNPFYLKQAQRKQPSLYDGKVLLEKHDPPVVHDSEKTLQLAQESRDKMKQMNKEIKPANYTKINHLSGVFVPQTALLREELYFSNNFKTANVSKSISIPNEDISDDTTPSVARKFLNKEAAKFVGDFESLANEDDASFAKHKALELEIERLLKAVVSQDIMIILQNKSVVDTSDLQTELER
nr:hypothetical protein [Tanacetum cinerariifolium]